MAALKKKGMPPIADRITLPWPRRAHCDAAIGRGLDQRQVGPTADVVAEPPEIFRFPCCSLMLTRAVP